MHTTKTLAALLIAALTLPGCATRPANVAPEYVSANRYDDRSCKSLLREYDDVSSALGAASDKLDSKATQDAVVTGVGALLFWPALFALGGNAGMEQQVARLKGEQAAIKTKMRDAGCDEPRAPAPAAPVTPTAASPTPSATAVAGR